MEADVGRGEVRSPGAQDDTGADSLRKPQRVVFRGADYLERLLLDRPEVMTSAGQLAPAEDIHHVNGLILRGSGECRVAPFTEDGLVAGIHRHDAIACLLQIARD